MLDIIIEDIPQGKVVAISGRLDTKTAPDFEKAGISWIEQGCRRIALDLSRLEYVSSAGLRAILVLAKKMLPAAGKIVIFGMTGVVEEVFSISGFDSLLPVKKNREDAISALS